MTLWLLSSQIQQDLLEPTVREWAKKDQDNMQDNEKIFCTKNIFSFLGGIFKVSLQCRALNMLEPQNVEQLSTEKISYESEGLGKGHRPSPPRFPEGKESSSPHLSANVLTCCNSVCIMFPGSFFLCYGENNAEDAHPDLPIQGAQGRQVCMQCASTQLPLFWIGISPPPGEWRKEKKMRQCLRKDLLDWNHVHC